MSILGWFQDRLDEHYIRQFQKEQQKWMDAQNVNGFSFMRQGSVTGRLSYNQPEVQKIPGNPFFGTYDYSEVEEAIAKVSDGFQAIGDSMSNVIQQVIDERELREWLAGNRPDLNVKPDYSAPQGLTVEYGLAHKYLGTLDKLYENGWRVEVRHERYYYDAAGDQAVLLRPNRAKWELPLAVKYIYHSKAPVTEVGINLDFAQEPLGNGGETTATVYAPNGHWATGVAVCNRTDQFDKKFGRALALQRAFENLNEVA